MQKKTFTSLCAGLRTERYVYPYKYIPVGRWGSGKALVSHNFAKLCHNFLAFGLKFTLDLIVALLIVHARSPNLQAYTRVSVQYHGYCTSGRGIFTSQRQVKKALPQQHCVSCHTKCRVTRCSNAPVLIEAHRRHRIIPSER